MIMKSIKKIRTHIFALLFCLAPLSFAASGIKVDDINQLIDARAYYEYFFTNHNVAKYALSYLHSADYQKAEQYQKLLETGAVVEEPVPEVNETFLSAFKQLNISSSEQLEYLNSAFSSPIYKASPNLQQLISVYHSVAYGSKVQSTLQNNLNWDHDRSDILSFLGNYLAYYTLYALGKKPELQEFLYATSKNGGSPVLYNPPHSQFLSSVVANSGDDYWENLGDEALHGYLWLHSCNNNGEELHNKIAFMQNCKTDKHDGYPELRNLVFDKPELLEVKEEKTKNPKVPSKMRLTPTLDYYSDYSDQDLSREAYSLKSLNHLMTRVVEDKTEGALFFVLYRGADKYQFFTVGLYQGFLSLTYVVDHHAPTPTLNYLIPLKGMDLNLLVNGIHSMLHQDKSNHSMVPDLQGVWMISSQ